jgi:hypothetical protein
MKADWSHLEPYRANKNATKKLNDHKEGDHFGFFMVTAGPDLMRCMAHDGNEPGIEPELAGWEHVSVSVVTHKGTRLPTWNEMCRVKDLFWEDTETVVQFHPPKADYVNTHPHVLHLWRHTEKPFPRPPRIMV